MAFAWFVTAMKTDESEEQESEYYSEPPQSPQQPNSTSQVRTYFQGPVNVIILTVFLASVFFLGLFVPILRIDRISNNPENTVVLILQEGILSCWYSAENQLLSWTKDELSITSGRNISSPETYGLITTASTQYELLIFKASLLEAGQYCCSMTPAKHYGCAELISINEYPTCTILPTLVEGEEYELNCLLEYRGRWAPVMSWSDNRGSHLPVTNTTDTDFIRYTVIGQVAAMDDNGKVYRMEAHLPPPLRGAISENSPDSPLRVYSRTAPRYRVTWESEPLNVLYSVRDMSIEPLQTEYLVGDTVQCIAAGNPAPSVQWLRNDTNSSDSMLIITEDMIGTDTYICRAENTVEGVNYTDRLVVTFSVSNKEPYQYAGVIAGTLVAVFILVLVIWILVLKRYKFNIAMHRRSDPNETPQNAPRKTKRTKRTKTSNRTSDIEEAVENTVEYGYAAANEAYRTEADDIYEEEPEFRIEEPMEEEAVYGYAIEGPTYADADVGNIGNTDEGANVNRKNVQKKGTNPQRTDSINVNEIELQNIRQQFQNGYHEQSRNEEADIYEDVTPYQNSRVEKPVEEHAEYGYAMENPNPSFSNEVNDDDSGRTENRPNAKREIVKEENARKNNGAKHGSKASDSVNAAEIELQNIRKNLKKVNQESVTDELRTPRTDAVKEETETSEDDAENQEDLPEPSFPPPPLPRSVTTSLATAAATAHSANKGNQAQADGENVYSQIRKVKKPRTKETTVPQAGNDKEPIYGNVETQSGKQKELENINDDDTVDSDSDTSWWTDDEEESNI